MSEQTYEEDDERRPRLLTNLQVLGFVWRRWMEQPRRFVAVTGLFLLGTFCELAIPWAAGGLVDAVNGILAAAGGGKAALVAAVDGGKRTPLMYVAWAERGVPGPLCSALIGAGADPAAKDAKGRTMEAYAHVGAAAT